MHNAMSRTLQQRSAPVWLAGAAVATAVGIILSATATKLPGASPLTVEDAVDADAEVALGGLGVVLIRRGVAAGLGRALLLIAVLAGAMWLCGGLADAITDGGTPPKAAQLLTLASTVLFLPVFVLLFAAPLLLFPTGHLPSPRWRWVVSPWCPAPSPRLCRCCSHPALSMRTFPRGGDNPLGVQALDGLTSALEVVGLVLLLACVPASLGAVIVRLVRYHDARRAQMWWFVAGVAPLLVGLVTDTGASPVAALVSAVVIFATMLGGMAWALLGTPGRKVATQETRQAWPTPANGEEGSNHELQCITASGRARPSGSARRRRGQRPFRPWANPPQH
jgi:hypothetical protein